MTTQLSESTYGKSHLAMSRGSSLIAWLGVFAISLLISACADFEPLAQPEIRSDAQLSISPSGNQVFLFRRDPGKYAKMHGRLFNVGNGQSRWVRDVTLPEVVWDTAWAYEEDHLLIAGGDGDDKVLWKLNVNTDQKTEIYRGKQFISFLHEFTPGRYIFLEAYSFNSGHRYSKWQVLEKGVKRQLSNDSYGAASYLSNIDGNLFLYPPNKILRVIEGEFPDLPPGVLDRTPWSLNCQGAINPVCVQSYLKKYKEFYYSSTLELIGSTGRCVTPGDWFSASSEMLSRDGKSLIFHAATSLIDKERKIFLVRFDEDTCLVDEIKLQGE